MRVDPVTLLGNVPIDDVTMDETVAAIEALVRIGRADGQHRQVCTVNVDFVVNAVGEPEVLELLQRAALCIPDGRPLLWHARAQGSTLRERVAGADLVPALAARSATGGPSLYFYGSAPGVAERATAQLLEANPGARITADSGAAMRTLDDMDPADLQRIRAADPDVVCVALGNPKQERWIARYGPELGAPVLIGVGGTFDLLVGVRRRAPGWMQRIGLEWAWRAAQEPMRLGPRYARDGIVVGPRIVREARATRRNPPAPRGPASIAVDGRTLLVRPQGSFDVTAEDQLGAMPAPASFDALRLDLAGIAGLDAVTLRSTVALLRSARRCGVPATLVNVPSVDPDAEQLLARSA